MKSLKQFFSFLNDVDFPYVVLRNWDHLPYSVELGNHSDLDLLVYDLPHFLETIPDITPEFPLPRVRFKLQIEDQFTYLDVRYVGDGYYPENFQRDILNTREKNDRGFWTPDPIRHQIALAYHAVHHKNGISSNYRRWLGDANISDLLDALKKSSIGWAIPNDPTVGRFNPYWKGATAIVEKKGDRVIKKQTGWKNYDLISNEARILKSISGKHFPLLFDVGGGTLTIEDCGEKLSVKNMPENWKRQMAEILEELKLNGILHRDIRPDNFMVKNGIIKLIDFGWALFEGEILEDGLKNLLSPPACLGYPFKSSEGFNDKFSMRMVVKHFEYLLENVS